MQGSSGEFMWGGAAGTFFWVDAKEQLAVVLMSRAPRDGWRGHQDSRGGFTPCVSGWRPFNLSANNARLRTYLG